MILKRTANVILTTLLINSVCSGQWVSVDKNSFSASKPRVQILSEDASGTVIKVELPGYTLEHFKANGKTYSSINIGDEGITSEAGFPEIPHIAKVLAIPDKGTISVDVIELGEKQVFKNVNVPPARQSWKEGDPETPYLENAAVYSVGDVYPKQLASVEEPSVFRDFRIARVSIFPIR